MIEGLDPLSGGMDGSGSGKPLTDAKRVPGVLEIATLAVQWVEADTKARALRKARAEIITRYGGCSRNNQRGPEGYALGPCYLEMRPDFEGCVCCTESQSTHLAYRAAAAKASGLRRTLKRAARIMAGTNPPGNPPVPPAQKGAA